MRDLNVIILAAGKSSRFKSKKPKPLHEIAGWPMIRYVWELCLDIEASLITTVADPNLADVLMKVNLPGPIIVDLSDGDEVASLWKALGAIGPKDLNIAVLPCDLPYLSSTTFRQAMAQFTDSYESISVLTDHLGQVPLGVVIGYDATLRQLLNAYEEHERHELDLFSLITNARRQGIPVVSTKVQNDCEAINVDDRIALARAEACAQGILRSRVMKEGVTLIEPDSTYFHWDCKVASGSVIHPRTHIMYGSVIGLCCEIGPETMIKSSSVHSRSRVQYSYVENTIVGEDSEVGPYVHLLNQSVPNCSRITNQNLLV
jgi:bifunctional UDP-N-acetylglucosamine pyrophosphorylase / glucosamine-1-phosphate N-acetyltransferase